MLTTEVEWEKNSTNEFVKFFMIKIMKIHGNGTPLIYKFHINNQTIP